MRKTIISAALALAVAACGKADEGDKKPADPAPTTPATGGETATAPDPAATAADAGAADPAAGDPAAGDPAAATPTEPDVAPEAAGATEVPTSEDFEEKASKDVGEKNLEQEVGKMEKELGVEPAKK